MPQKGVQETSLPQGQRSVLSCLRQWYQQVFAALRMKTKLGVWSDAGRVGPRMLPKDVFVIRSSLVIVIEIQNYRNLNVP